MSESFQFGLSKSFPCSYLPKQQERLLIATDPRLQQSVAYGWLLEQGFRRSGDQLYRPHCEFCQACQSIRVLIDEFSPSASQRRLLKKNNDFRLVYNNQGIEQYYPLYEKYITQVHADGSMYPPSFEQYQHFISCHISNQLFIETWHQNKLICVAITDELDDALSAVYTFYDPEYRKSALGIYSILCQLQLCRLLGKRYLYLGYQIDDCNKMNYKDRYYPHERFIENQWKKVNK